VDECDVDDPQAVVEYVNDIFGHLREKESVERVLPTFLDIQDDINERMRAILVDWLVDVQVTFKLIPETLYLSVNILNRFLSLVPIRREQLQLVGICAMLIACKYEEIYPPECNDFIYISDGACTREQIVELEMHVLTTLKFKLTMVSPLDFLRRFSKVANSDYSIHTLCKYIIESMLLDVQIIYYLPSMIAAGSIYIARSMTRQNPLWTPTLEYYTTYEESEVRECAMYMHSFLKVVSQSQLKSIKKKVLQF